MLRNIVAPLSDCVDAAADAAAAAYVAAVPTVAGNAASVFVCAIDEDPRIGISI